MSGAPKEEKKDDAAEAPKSGGGRKMGPMLAAVAVVVLLQAGLAVGVVRFLGIGDRAPGKDKHSAKVSEDGTDGGDDQGGDDAEDGGKKKEKRLECLEKPLSKTVTIAGTEAKRYLKASFCIEYDALKYKDMPKQMESQMMRVEATVNRILSTADFKAVSDPKAQDTLTTQMTREINRLLKPEKIQINSVLVTEWLVQ
jgi:flagellar basal body-associated protein FliL